MKGKALFIMKKLITYGIVIVLSSLLCSAQKIINNQKHYRNLPKKECSIFFNLNDKTYSNINDAILYLKTHKQEYNLPGNAFEDLKFKSERPSLLGKHYRLQKYINNIPVERAELILSINDNGKIYRCFNNLHDYTYINTEKRINKENALDIAWDHLKVYGKLMSMPIVDSCFIQYGDSLILCYKVDINTLGPYGHWGVNIDAYSGDVLTVYETAISEKTNKSMDFNHHYEVLLDREEAVNEYLCNSLNSKFSSYTASSEIVNGTAKVFDPDPATTLMDDELTDDDHDTCFGGSYFTRDLLDIEYSEEQGLYRLNGPWVKICDFEPPNTSPSTTSDGNWYATRKNNAFNDVMAYFHIDQNQRYVQSLGYTGENGIHNVSIEVDTDAINGDDNSFFWPPNWIKFGHGGVDATEDADVILHEYMHALLWDINNYYSNPSGDLGALAEGFADYWGGSYSLTTTNGQSFYPNWFATWEGHSPGAWGGRMLNKTNLIYDPNETYEAHGNNYLDDEIWSAPIFQSLLDVIAQGGSRPELDKIMLESNFGLGANITMHQMALSIINTAESLHPDNIHTPILLTRFSNQEFVLKDIYIDASNSGTEDGSAANPYNTIQEGYDAVLPSGTLHISEGNYQIGDLILNKRMTVEAEENNIVIDY